MSHSEPQSSPKVTTIDEDELFEFAEDIKAIFTDPAYKNFSIDERLEMYANRITEYYEFAKAQLEQLLIDARIDEVEKIKLVTYREEMVRYADLRLSDLNKAKGK